MKVKLILLEGSHEVAFVHRMIQLLGFEFIKPVESDIVNWKNRVPNIFGDSKINLSAFYTKRIKAKSFNKKGICYDLAPYFYINNQNDIIISWEYGGNRKREEIDNILKQVRDIIFDESIFAIEEIEAFSILIHTDADENLENSMSGFTNQFLPTDFLVKSDEPIQKTDTNIYTNVLKLSKTHNSSNFVNKVEVFLYVLTTNKESNDGNLDSVIDLLLKENAFYSDINNIVENAKYEEKTKKKKCLIGALGQEFEPGGSNTVMLGNVHFISNIQVQETDFYRTINYFISK